MSDPNVRPDFFYFFVKFMIFVYVILLLLISQKDGSFVKKYTQKKKTEVSSFR